MSNRYLFFILLACFTSFQCKEPKTNCSDNNEVKGKLIVPPSKHFNSNYLTFNTKKDIVLFMESYLSNILYSDRNTRRKYWDNVDNSFFNSPDIFLKTFVNEDLMAHKLPQLLALQEITSTKFRAVIGFYSRNGLLIKINSVDIITKNKEFILTNTVFETFNDLEISISTLGSQYYSNPLFNIDMEYLKEMDLYNEEIANFFNADIIKYRAIISSSYRDILTKFGFEYSFKHFTDYKYGGLAYPSENLLLIGDSKKNSIRHEIVHLYSSSFSPNPFLDEGICIYLSEYGTAQFDELVRYVANHLQTDSTLTFDDFTEFIAIRTRYTSVACAVLIKLALDKYGGKKSVIKLLSGGNTENEFYDTIDDVFNIKRDKFNQFIKKQILNYEYIQ